MIRVKCIYIPRRLSVRATHFACCAQSGDQQDIFCTCVIQPREHQIILIYIAVKTPVTCASQHASKVNKLLGALWGGTRAHMGDELCYKGLYAMSINREKSPQAPPVTHGIYDGKQKCCGFKSAYDCTATIHRHNPNPTTHYSIVWSHTLFAQVYPPARRPLSWPPPSRNPPDCPYKGGHLCKQPCVKVFGRSVFSLPAISKCSIYSNEFYLFNVGLSMARKQKGSSWKNRHHMCT